MTAPAAPASRRTSPPPTASQERSADFREYGLTGLQQYSGFIAEEWHKDLRGDKALKVYDEMRLNSPIVAACLYAIQQLSRQVRWSVEGDNEQAIEFAESNLHDMSQSWEDTLTEILSCVPFGFSYHELVYKRRSGPQPEGSGTPASNHTDGLIGWRKIPIRAQLTRERWEFDPLTQSLRGMWQLVPTEGTRRFIPIEKALLFRPTSHKQNPEGQSLLRSAYRPWFFAKRIEELEAIGIERNLAGLPVLYVPPEVLNAAAGTEMAQLREQFKKIIVNIRRGEQEGMLVPSSYDSNGNQMFKLELLSTATGTQSRVMDTSTVLTRYYTQIAQSVMADFLQLGHEKVGSYALSESKTSMFALALGALLDAIASVFTRFAFPRLLAVNGMPLDPSLKLVHSDVDEPAILEVADAMQKLGAAGMPLFPDPKLEAHLRDRLKLPELSEEEMAERDTKIEEQKLAEQDAALEQIEASKPPAKPPA